MNRRLFLTSLAIPIVARLLPKPAAGGNIHVGAGDIYIGEVKPEPPILRAVEVLRPTQSNVYASAIPLVYGRSRVWHRDEFENVRVGETWRFADKRDEIFRCTSAPVRRDDVPGNYEMQSERVFGFFYFHASQAQPV